MVQKIQSMPLNVVLQLAKAELMSACRTSRVKVIGVGIDDDIRVNDEDGECSLMVTACIQPEEECFKEDCGVHPWVLRWDEEECDFISSMRWDQDADDKNKGMQTW